jgi:hypothetical protein
MNRFAPRPTCLKCRSVQSSKEPTLAYARARNFAIKTGTRSAHGALQGIVFYMKAVQSIIGATEKRQGFCVLIAVSARDPGA